MTLNLDSKYPSRRAYVIKLSADAAPGALAGRLENLVSGKQREFASAGQLVEFIKEDIEWK